MYTNTETEKRINVLQNQRTREFPGDQKEDEEKKHVKQ